MDQRTLQAALAWPDCRVVLARSSLAGRLEDLMPAERGYVENSVAGRQVEFASGRMLARRLLSELGRSEVAIARDEDRVPCWPAGIIGSISHSDVACLVAVSQDASLRGVGVDVEANAPRSSRFFARIATDRERVAIESHTAAPVMTTQLFSIKEAVYKACFPRTRERWGFRDIEIELDLELGGGSSRFEATVPISAAQLGSVVGRSCTMDGQIWSVAYWRVGSSLEPAST